MKRMILLMAAGFLMLAGTDALRGAAPGGRDGAAGLANATREPLTIEGIFGGSRFNENLPGEILWLPDSSAFIYRQTVDGTESLWRQDVKEGRIKKIADWPAVEQVLSAARPGYRPPAMDDVNTHPGAGREPSLSPDGRYYLSSACGDLFLLDLQTGQPRFLTDAPGDERFATFSPDGKFIAFTRQGDLYETGLAAGQERRLTNRGSGSRLQNGEADWVAEEELNVTRSFWWSPRTDCILYAQYDTSPVAPFPVVNHLDPASAVEWQYHPAAGAANAKVRLMLLDRRTGTSRILFDAGAIDAYLPRAGWWPDGSLIWFQTLNRDQNRLELRVMEPAAAASRILLTEEDPAWVDVPEAPVFAGVEQFIWLSERDGFRHAYLYRRDGTLLRQLTRGEWQIDELSGLAENPGRLLLRGNAGDPRESHLYSVSLDGGGLQRLTPAPGWHQASVSPGGAWLLDTRSDLNTPPGMDLLDSAGRLVRPVCAGGIPALAGVRLGTTERGTLTAGDGTALYWSMVRPDDFDPARKYPVLVYVYGGPGVQLVTNAWPGSAGLFQHCLAGRGLIVFTLDNRGSSRRGRAFERSIYRRLGQLELADQIRGVEFLRSLPYVDSARIGVYGGSYGGYMALMCMNKAPAYFRAGIAYAPVTGWELYDSIYTERYMDRPQDNPEGYRQGAPMNFAAGMTGRLLICHGTADNNVHLKNTVMMTDEYVKNGKQFELMLYPNIRHGIRRSKYRLHFHTLKADFLQRHLIMDGPR